MRALSPDGRRAALACAWIGFLVSAFSVNLILTSEGANATTLVRMAPEEPMASIAQAVEGSNFRFVPRGHYDGVYYYAIAIDPLATGEAHEVIDLASHRYGHPGYGWLAWIASAGQAQWVPEALLGLSLLGMAVASYFASLVSVQLGGSAWGGLLVALNPGLIFAVTTDTSEAVTAAILAIALYLWFGDRRGLAAGLIAFVCFFKFQMVLVPVGLGLWELIVYARERRTRDLLRNGALLAIGPVLFLAWLGFLESRFGDTPLAGGPEFLSLPFAGWYDTLSRLANVAPMGDLALQIASAELPILVCVLALVTAGIVLTLRPRHAIDALFLFQGLFLLLLNDWNLWFPKDLIRALAIPIPLLVAVFYLRRRGGETPESLPA